MTARLISGSMWIAPTGHTGMQFPQATQRWVDINIDKWSIPEQAGLFGDGLNASYRQLKHRAGME
jgi:hypothetical protein